MRRIFLLFLLFVPLRLAAQTSTDVQSPPQADQRYKADILVVVAHPDDEGAATPFLARAIYDQRKRVAVVFGTRGGSGANDAAAETGPSLAAVREIEARRACAVLGIENVWFLRGKDTASQNVLQSLSNWGHGAALEELVRIVRLTRPEVILTWLPGVFIGENHGDHQAAGVLASEAFDLAGEPAAFPEQIAGPARRLDSWLGNLHPWQPKKIYYFSDATNDAQFQGAGPSYSVKEISPSRKVPYWRLAFDAARPHRTQFGPFLEPLEKMTEAELEKALTGPDGGWTEPLRFIFGKSHVGGGKQADVFEGIHSGAISLAPPARASRTTTDRDAMRLAGPWGFYEEFRRAHALESLPLASVPEIAIEAGTVVYVPLRLRNSGSTQNETTLDVAIPEGWKVLRGAGAWRLAPGQEADVRVEVQTPALPQDSNKPAHASDIVVRATSGGRAAGEVRVRVELRPHALTQ